jgi:hypothetical protein
MGLSGPFYVPMLFLAALLLGIDTFDMIEWDMKHFLERTEAVISRPGDGSLQTRIQKFCSLGREFLEEYAGRKSTCHDDLCSHLELEGKRRFTPDQILARVLSVPDPEQPGKSFVLLQAAFADWTDPNAIVDPDETRLSLLSVVLKPWFRRVAEECNANCGAMVFLQLDGWHIVYFDGHHFMVIKCLEATPEHIVKSWLGSASGYDERAHSYDPY